MKTILVDAIDWLINPDGSVFQEMHVMLEKFSNNKIILTNADYKKDNKYNLNNAPYKVFSLSHNPNKIDSKYYEMMLDEYNLSLGDVVYFDHSEQAVKSAQSIGITTYHYDKDKKDLEALEQFLNENI